MTVCRAASGRAGQVPVSGPSLRDPLRAEYWRSQPGPVGRPTGLVDGVRIQLAPVWLAFRCVAARGSRRRTGQHRRHRLVSCHSSAVRPGWLLTSDGASGGRSGVASGSAASCSSASMLSSAAVLFSRRRPQWVHRWINTQRRSPRTVTAIGSIPPGQPDFRSPGTLRSRCLDHRQRGQ
jgi:hypothetical protein